MLRLMKIIPGPITIKYFLQLDVQLILRGGVLDELRFTTVEVAECWAQLIVQ